MRKFLKLNKLLKMALSHLCYYFISFRLFKYNLLFTILFKSNHRVAANYQGSHTNECGQAN